MLKRRRRPFQHQYHSQRSSFCRCPRPRLHIQRMVLRVARDFFDARSLRRLELDAEGALDKGQREALVGRRRRRRAPTRKQARRCSRRRLSALCWAAAAAARAAPAARRAPRCGARRASPPWARGRRGAPRRGSTAPHAFLLSGARRAAAAARGPRTNCSGRRTSPPWGARRGSSGRRGGAARRAAKRFDKAANFSSFGALLDGRLLGHGALHVARDEARARSAFAADAVGSPAGLGGGRGGLRRRRGGGVGALGVGDDLGTPGASAFSSTTPSRRRRAARASGRTRTLQNSRASRPETTRGVLGLLRLY